MENPLPPPSPEALCQPRQQRVQQLFECAETLRSAAETKGGDATLNPKP